MLHNEPVAAGPRPPYLVDQQWGLLPPVVIDTVPGGTLSDIACASSAVTPSC